MEITWKTYIYRPTTILLQVFSMEQKNKIKFSLAILNIEDNIPNIDNNRDNLKTYVYR